MFRWFAFVIFLVALAIVLWRARGTKEKPPAVRLFVVAPLFLSTVAALGYPPVMAWASLDLSNWFRWAGLLLGIVANLGIYWVFSTFSRHVGKVTASSPARLLTTGPYRWVRHPMYAVMLTLFWSIGTMVLNSFILLYTTAVLFVVIFLVIPREEARLAAMFGDDWEQYRSRTGAFVPFLLHNRRPRTG